MAPTALGSLDRWKRLGGLNILGLQMARGESAGAWVPELWEDETPISVTFQVAARKEYSRFLFSLPNLRMLVSPAWGGHL